MRRLIEEIRIFTHPVNSLGRWELHISTIQLGGYNCDAQDCIQQVIKQHNRHFIHSNSSLKIVAHSRTVACTLVICNYKQCYIQQYDCYVEFKVKTSTMCPQYLVMKPNQGYILEHALCRYLITIHVFVSFPNHLSFSECM